MQAQRPPSPRPGQACAYGSSRHKRKLGASLPPHILAPHLVLPHAASGFTSSPNPYAIVPARAACRACTSACDWRTCSRRATTSRAISMLDFCGTNTCHIPNHPHTPPKSVSVTDAPRRPCSRRHCHSRRGGARRVVVCGVWQRCGSGMRREAGKANKWYQETPERQAH